MVFQVPESAAADHIFEFTLPGSDKVWQLPLLGYLKANEQGNFVRVAAKVKRSGDKAKKDSAILSEVMDLQRELIEKHCPGLYDLVTVDQLEALVVAWQEASKVRLGESSQQPARSQSSAKK